METGAGGASSLAHLREHLPLTNALPFLDDIGSMMRIHSQITAVMAHDHNIPISSKDIAKDHFPIRRSQHART